MKRRTRLKPPEVEVSRPPVFVLYVKPPKPVRQVKMTVGLRNDRQIAVNAAAARQLGQFPAIRLHYALKERILQLHPAALDEKEAIPIPPSARKEPDKCKNFSLNVPGYLKQWQLEELKGQRFVVERADGIFQADLNHPLPADDKKT